MPGEPTVEWHALRVLRGASRVRIIRQNGTHLTSGPRISTARDPPLGIPTFRDFRRPQALMGQSEHPPDRLGFLLADDQLLRDPPPVRLQVGA